MYGGRRGRGFERAGHLPAGRLGLPTRRARQLVLADAWRGVAGAAIAARAPAVDVRRGVVEIELPDGTWGQTLRDLLPGLAARLAAARPALSITRYRLRERSAERRSPSIALPEVSETALPEPVPAADPVAPPSSATSSVEEVMARYLERQKKRRPVSSQAVSSRPKN